MLKFCFQNKQPKVLNYRDYRNYSSEDLKQDLAAALNDCCDSYDVFEQRFVANLNKNAPKKKKLIRGQDLKIKQMKLKAISTSEITKRNETS